MITSGYERTNSQSSFCVAKRSETPPPVSDGSPLKREPNYLTATLANRSYSATSPSVQITLVAGTL